MAEALGKFHYEVEQIPCEEFDNWFLYFEWKNEQEKKAQKEAEKKNKGKGKNGGGGNTKTVTF